jgi:hypothetical protein
MIFAGSCLVKRTNFHDRKPTNGISEPLACGEGAANFGSS